MTDTIEHLSARRPDPADAADLRAQPVIPLPADLPPYPDGWFALCLADELPAGALLSRTFAGQELIVFRTAAGVVSVMDAYCPHLGAHIGKGGCVKGETVECPFHAFRFDVEGRCVATGYDTKPPAKAVIRAWRVLERNGLIMVWYDAEGREPEWEPPEVDWTGWTPLRVHTLDVKSHPQETTENSVDLGHLTVVHGYSAVNVLDPLEVDGPYLTSRYTMTRENPYFKRMPEIVTAFRVHVWGLGYSFVEIHAENFDLNFRLFILPCPRDGERMDLRVAVAVHEDYKPKNVNPLLFWMPKRWFTPLLQKGTLNGVVNDVIQDFDMWQNKIYVDPPILAKGDGPIGRYRKYCRQFYPETRNRARRAAAE